MVMSVSGDVCTADGTRPCSFAVLKRMLLTHRSDTGLLSYRCYIHFQLCLAKAGFPFVGGFWPAFKLRKGT